VKKISLLIAVLLMAAILAPATMAQENRALWSLSTYVQSAKIQYAHVYKKKGKLRSDLYMSIDLMREASGRYPRVPEVYNMLGSFFAEIRAVDTMIAYFDSVEITCADQSIPAEYRKNCYKVDDNFIEVINGIRQKFWEESYNDGVEFLRQYDTIRVMKANAPTDDSAKVIEALREKAINMCLHSFETAKKLKPKDPLAYNGMGILLEREKKHPEAIDQFKEAMRLKGEDSVSVSRIAYAYIEIPDWKNAIIWFERLLDYTPKNTSVMINLSIAYSQLNEYDKAQEYNEKVLAVESTNAQALFNAGQYWFMKMQEAAVAISDVPDSAKDAEARRKELDAQALDARTKAEGYFERIIANNPNDKDALKRLGILYLLSQQNEKAAEAFAKHMAVDSTDASVLDYLGRAYIQMGKFQEAIRPYEILISTDPGNAEGWERLEELYRYTNQPEKADQAKKTAEDLRKM